MAGAFPVMEYGILKFRKISWKNETKPGKMRFWVFVNTLLNLLRGTTPMLNSCA